MAGLCARGERTREFGEPALEGGAVLGGHAFAVATGEAQDRAGFHLRVVSAKTMPSVRITAWKQNPLKLAPNLIQRVTLALEASDFPTALGHCGIVEMIARPRGFGNFE